MDDGKANFEIMEGRAKEMGKTSEHVLSIYNLSDFLLFGLIHTKVL